MYPSLMFIIFTFIVHRCLAASPAICTITSGQAGLCISNTICTEGDGIPEAGHCSGPSNIQCCTYGSCSVATLSGLCQPNATCTGGGTTWGGYCGGDASIQCCTYGSCSVGTGQAPGQCGLGSLCADDGGTSTGGLCPGPDGVKCCSYGTCSANGKSGSCQTEGSCSGTSYGSLCPGGDNIQCCTPGTVTVDGSPCGALTVNQATLELIKGFEGWFRDIYDDPDGHPTVGWGHLCDDPSCSDVKYPIPLSETDGQELLLDDLAIAERCISDMFASSVSLNPNQYGALVSWAFNVGCGAARSSTLVSKLNTGQDPNTVAGDELPKWNRGDSGVLPGLTRRRAAEVVLFTTTAGGVALPRPC